MVSGCVDIMPIVALDKGGICHMADVKTDCFGYNPRAKRCTIMTETICEDRNCSFYKTREEYAEGLQKYPTKKKQDNE